MTPSPVPYDGVMPHNIPVNHYTVLRVIPANQSRNIHATLRSHKREMAIALIDRLIERRELFVSQNLCLDGSTTLTLEFGGGGYCCGREFIVS